MHVERYQHKLDLVAFVATESQVNIVGTTPSLHVHSAAVATAAATAAAVELPSDLFVLLGQ